MGFVLFFSKELFVSSFRVTVDVLSFRSNFTPGVIAFPLRAERDIEIVLLSNVSVYARHAELGVSRS